MLGLTVIPCMDVHAIDNEQSLSTIITESQDEHNDLDLCSPFCYCSCCQTLFEDSSQGSVLSEPLGFKVFIFTLEMEVLDSQLPLWRPPKV